MDSPFAREVLECPFPPEFKLPQLESYNRGTSPLDHIRSFKTEKVEFPSTDDKISIRRNPKILCEVFQLRNSGNR